MGEQLSSRHVLALLVAIDEIEMHLTPESDSVLALPVCEWEGVKRIADAVQAEINTSEPSPLIDTIIASMTSATAGQPAVATSLERTGDD